MSRESQALARLFASFEDCRFEHDGADAWRARGLMPLLGYANWQNFREAIRRARASCASAGIDPAVNFLVADGSMAWTPEEVFTESSKNPQGGPSDGIFRESTKNSRGGRPSEDVILTRRAAYLVAMNGDTMKPEIGFAQNYFAASTRTLEVLQQRLAEQARLKARGELGETEARFQSILYEHDVSGPGLNRIRSKGDRILLGGKGLRDMREKWNVPAGRALADFAPEVVVIAKQLGAAMTTHNVRNDNLRGEQAIMGEHAANNGILRESLVLRGIEPETLDGEEDIRKVERRHRSDAIGIAKPGKKPPASSRKRMPEPPSKP